MKKIVVLLAMVLGVIPCTFAGITIQTKVFDANSQPPIVGGVIGGYSDGSVTKKGIIVSVNNNDLFYDAQSEISFPYYYSGREDKLNYAKDLRIIDCSNAGKEQFWSPLLFLKSETYYYIRAYVIKKDGSINYGQIESLRSLSFSRYNGRSDYGNVWHAFNNTLFDLVTDEIINPSNGFYYSTNENPTTVRQQTGTSYNTCYKFATRWNYRLWYYHSMHCVRSKIVNVPQMTFSNNKLYIEKSPTDAGKDITIYYSINGNFFRPETYTNKYTGPITISEPCTVCCYAISSDGYISYTNMYVITSSQMSNNSDNVPGVVDLGLTSGTLWATCNIGASSPEDYGDYFAWGETAPKSNYVWSTYKYGNGSHFTKYNSTDKLTQLELEDDAAYVILGKDWRMPTHEEELELAKECSWKSVTINGISGYKVTGPNGNSIFMPRGGLYDGTDYACDGTAPSNVNTCGWYWSSTLNSVGSAYAQGFCFFPSLLTNVCDHERSDGHNIRPVYVGEPQNNNGGGNNEDNTFDKVANVVDLGLSVKWASWNVGAEKPEGLGNLYAWGELSPKTDYSSSTYKFYNGGYTKYGSVDNKHRLDSDDDIATQAWGDNWRMPTFEELKELKEKCSFTKTELNGVPVTKVVGPNGNFIYFPYPGNYTGKTLYYENSIGSYWSSDLESDSYAQDIDYISGMPSLNGDTRYHGQAVRPVYDNGSSTKCVVHLESAGKLKDKLNNTNSGEILDLKISGYMDARDFDFIKWHCMKVRNVDLSEVKIAAYTGSDGTNEGYNYTYAANEIPLGAFFYWTTSYKYNYEGMPSDEGMPSLRSIKLPNGIKAIRRNAFARAYNLTEVNIPEGVETIDYVAFAICQSLAEITLPSSLKEVGTTAFADMPSLKTVYINATYPPTCASDAFQNLSNDAILYVPTGTKTAYQTVNGWKTFKTIIEVEEVEQEFESDGICYIIGENNTISVTSKPEKYTGAVSIPNQVNYNGTDYSVTSIGPSAFEGCVEVTSVSIPSSVTTIDNAAFYYCTGLKTLDIPNGVRIIGEGAFSKCGGLTSVTIPGSVTSIGKNAFFQCYALTQISSGIENPFAIDNGVFPTSVYNSASLLVPYGKMSAYQKTAGWKRFQNIVETRLVGKEFESDGIRYIIGENNTISVTFKTEKYSGDIYIPRQVYYDGIKYTITSIGQSAFEGCVDLTSVSIPSSVTTIDNAAFYYCTGLTTVDIPKSVKRIGEGAFSKCGGLTSVAIPGSVTSIGKNAFFQCYGLTQITSLIRSPFAIDNGVFPTSVYKNASLHVPFGTKVAYQKTAGWKRFQNIVSVGGAYKLTYYVDGEEYMSGNYDYGSKITPEPAPTGKEGFNFSGWSDIPDTMPAHDVTINGTYTTTGILSVALESGKAEIYTLNGRQVDTLQKGINIIRMEDGTIKKVFLSK